MSANSDVLNHTDKLCQNNCQYEETYNNYKSDPKNCATQIARRVIRRRLVLLANSHEMTCHGSVDRGLNSRDTIIK